MHKIHTVIISQHILLNKPLVGFCPEKHDSKSIQLNNRCVKELEPIVWAKNIKMFQVPNSVANVAWKKWFVPRYIIVVLVSLSTFLKLYNSSFRHIFVYFCYFCSFIPVDFNKIISFCTINLQFLAFINKK